MFYLTDLSQCAGSVRVFRLSELRVIQRLTGEIFGYQWLFRLDFGKSALTFAVKSEAERARWLQSVQAAIRRPLKIVDAIEHVNLVDFGKQKLPGPAWPHSGRSLTSLD